MRKIEVKDLNYITNSYGMNKVKVYVGETKAECIARIKQELADIQYNRQRGYSGFDEYADVA